MHVIQTTLFIFLKVAVWNLNGDMGGVVRYIAEEWLVLILLDEFKGAVSQHIGYVTFCFNGLVIVGKIGIEVIAPMPGAKT